VLWTENFRKLRLYQFGHADFLHNFLERVLQN